MKKSYISLCISMSLFLMIGTACSNDTTKKNSSSKVSKTKTSVKKNLTPQDKIRAQKFKIENKKVENSEFTVKIIKYRVIKPGKKGNVGGKKPVIAFWYDVKNKTGNKAIDPITVWQAVFNATQKGVDGKNKDLKIAPLPDDKYVESQMTIIKKGKTVRNATAYKLNNSKNPVNLVSKKSPFGEGKGEETFVIK